MIADGEVPKGYRRNQTGELTSPEKGPTPAPGSTGACDGDGFDAESVADEMQRLEFGSATPAPVEDAASERASLHAAMMNLKQIVGEVAALTQRDQAVETVAGSVKRIISTLATAQAENARLREALISLRDPLAAYVHGDIEIPPSVINGMLIEVDTALGAAKEPRT